MLPGPVHKSKAAVIDAWDSINNAMQFRLVEDKENEKSSTLYESNRPWKKYPSYLPASLHFSIHNPRTILRRDVKRQRYKSTLIYIANGHPPQTTPIQHQTPSARIILGVYNSSPHIGTIY